jgi:ribosomal protein S18 acetylase RimI-like enzyme
MNREVSIRPYRDEDWPAVCAVHDAARPDELAGSVDPRSFRSMAEVAGEELFFASETLVACEGTRVAGFVSYRGSYITWMYVAPSAYRRGIGRTLLREAMKRCGPKAWVNTLAGNAAAIALYLGEGFEVVKRIESDCEGYPCMSLRLALPTSRMYDARALAEPM